VDDVPVSVSAVSGKNADTNTKPLKETTNNLTLEEELEAMTKALKKVSLEKEQGEALLKAKEEELMAKTLEAERVQEQLNDSVEGKKKLEEKLRKLQKLKEFQPTLVNNLSLSYFLNRVIL
jgi:upstream-binding transcription factor